MEVEITPYLFRSPSCISISGSTSSGKTTWCKRLIEERDTIFQHPPKRIIYCYGVWQSIFEKMTGVEFREGLPCEDIGDGEEHVLLIVDDLMHAVVKDENMQNLFVRGSHHRNVTICYLNQNMFMQGKNARTINLNCHYIVLFRNARDIQQISTLGKQLGMGQTLVEAYRDAVSEQYGYLVIDLSPHNQSPYKLKSHVFSNEVLVSYL